MNGLKKLNRRSSLYQASILASSNIILQVLGFVYRVFLSRLVGAEGMGVYALTLQAYSVMYALCISGACVAVTTLTAKYYASGDYMAIRRLFRFAITAVAIQCLLLATPVLLFRDSIAEHLLGDARTSAALAVMLLCILLTGCENVLKSVFIGTGCVKYNAISELGEQLIRMVLVLLLVYKLANGDQGFTVFLIIMGMTLSELYSVSMLSLSYRRCFLRGNQNGGITVKRNGVVKPFLKLLLPSSATALISNLFSSACTIILPIRLMVAGFSRSEAVSALGVISGMIMPLMFLPMALIGAISAVLMPGISAVYENKSLLFGKISRAIRAVGFIALPFTAMLLPLAPTLCALLFHIEVDRTLVTLLGIDTALSYYLIISISILNGMTQNEHVFRYALVGEGLQLGLAWMLAALPQLAVYGYVLAIMIGDLVRLSLNLKRIASVCGASALSPKWFIGPIVTAALVLLYSKAIFGLLNTSMSSVPAALTITILSIAILAFMIMRLFGIHPYQYWKRTFFKL